MGNEFLIVPRQTGHFVTFGKHLSHVCACLHGSMSITLRSSEKGSMHALHSFSPLELDSVLQDLISV